MNGNFSDLKKRLFFSTVIVAMLVLTVYFSQVTGMRIAISILIATLVSLGLWEYSNMVKAKNLDIPIMLIITLSVCYIASIYFVTLSINYSVLMHFVIAVFFFAVFLFHFTRTNNAIFKLATSFFGAFYVVIPMSLILRILYPETTSTPLIDGRLWAAYLLAVTKFTDIGGYFTGKLWGARKLAEEISPNKTVLGFFGGFAGAVVISFVFYLIGLNVSARYFEMTLPQSLILGVLIGIFGQLGDLSESLLKRDANVKDSGKIPAIGGVLDLVDSLLFTSPIVYLFLKTT